jgi:hypothetical protein
VHGRTDSSAWFSRHTSVVTPWAVRSRARSAARSRSWVTPSRLVPARVRIEYNRTKCVLRRESRGAACPEPTDPHRNACGKGWLARGQMARKEGGAWGSGLLKERWGTPMSLWEDHRGIEVGQKREGGIPGIRKRNTKPWSGGGGTGEGAAPSRAVPACARGRDARAPWCHVPCHQGRTAGQAGGAAPSPAVPVASGRRF